MNEEIKEYLKQNLSIEIHDSEEYDGLHMTIKLLLENEEISSSYVFISIPEE